MTQEITKTCTKCSASLSLSSFYNSSTGKSGKSSICKKCNNIITKQYHAKNKNKIDALKKRKIAIICDFQISDNCEINYTICEYGYRKNVRNNNGSYRCKKCAATMTHLSKSKKYNTAHDFFSIIDSELKSYLLGVIAGDGHIAKNGQCLEIVANNQDISTLELFKNNISPNNIIKPHSSSENCSKIIICSVSMCKDICTHLNVNPGKKSDKISLPEWDDTLIIHFIRGLLDTDGWIKEMNEENRAKSCFYSSTSPFILEQIKLFISKFGINSKIDGIKLIMYGNNAFNFLKLIYNDAIVFLPRKHNRFLNWCKLWD
jgi:riboflavin synthase alpha subunit